MDVRRTLEDQVHVQWIEGYMNTLSKASMRGRLNVAGDLSSIRGVCSVVCRHLKQLSTDQLSFRLFLLFVDPENANFYQKLYKGKTANV